MKSVLENISKDLLFTKKNVRVAPYGLYIKRSVLVDLQMRSEFNKILNSFGLRIIAMSDDQLGSDYVII